jgi:hypothetical protein
VSVQISRDTLYYKTVDANVNYTLGQIVSRACLLADKAGAASHTEAGDDEEEPCHLDTHGDECAVMGFPWLFFAIFGGAVLFIFCCLLLPMCMCRRGGHTAKKNTELAVANPFKHVKPPPQPKRTNANNGSTNNGSVWGGGRHLQIHKVRPHRRQ